jgi:PAS domain S-box-containing protein
MIGTGAVAVLAFYAVIAFCAEAATALVLWRRAVVDRSGAVGVLALAYAIATLALAINAAALVGAVPLDPFGPVTWLWWHGLIPLGVLCAVRCGPGPIRAGTLATAALIVTVLLAGSLFSGHPLLRQTDLAVGLSPLAEAIAGVGIVLDVVALVVLARVPVFSPGLQPWIALALAGLALDQLLTLAGGARFSVPWFLARAFGLFATGAVLIGYVYDTFARITQLEDALRSARIFREVAQTLPHLVWAVNADGELEWCNDRWYAYTGQSPERARGSGWRAAYHPDDTPTAVRRWLTAIANAEPLQMDVRVKRRDGSYRWFELNARPLRGAGDAPVRWYVSHTDVDFARRNAEALTSVDTVGWRFSTDDAITAERARPAFVAYLAGRGLAGDALGAAEAVFGELVGNVVRHAPGPIEVDLRSTRVGYLLAVRDRGAGFTPPAPHLPDMLAESGRGLYLVSVLGSPPEVRRRPDGGAEVSVLLAREA